MQVKKKPKKTAKAVPEKSRKKKQPSEDQIKKQPFLKRMLFGEEKPDLSELEAGSTTILDILSPTTVDTKSRDYIIVDDVYHAYLYITGYGYTTTVGTCWLAPLVEAGEGINLSFLVKRQPKEKILSKIAQTTMVNRSRMRDVGDTRQDYEELDKVTISVTNNQFPLAPLFSPVYSTTRPYSQTRSNTQRDLLQPDEFLRLNKFLCIVMFNHYKPAQLYKIMLEELPEYKKLKKCSVFDYVPEWKKREEEGAKRRTAGNRTSAAARNTSSAPPAPQPSPASGKRPDMQPQTSLTEEAAASGSSCGNDNMTPEEIGLVEMTCEAILEGDDPELEEMDDPMRIPPGRGI